MGLGGGTGTDRFPPRAAVAMFVLGLCRDALHVSIRALISSFHTMNGYKSSSMLECGHKSIGSVCSLYGTSARIDDSARRNEDQFSA